MAQYGAEKRVPAKKVLAYLDKQSRSVSEGALAKEFGCSISRIMPALDELRAKGQAIRLTDKSGNSRYCVPEVGLTESLMRSATGKPMSKQEADKARRLLDKEFRPRLKALGKTASELSAKEFVDIYMDCMAELHPEDAEKFKMRGEGSLHSRLLEICELSDDIVSTLNSGQLNSDEIGRMLSEDIEMPAVADMETEAEPEAKAEVVAETETAVETERKEDKEKEKAEEAIEMKKESAVTKKETKTEVVVDSKDTGNGTLKIGHHCLSDAVIRYREDAVLAFIREHKTVTAEQIAKNYEHDPSYGPRMSAGTVRQTLNSLYAENGSWLMRTVGARGTYWWAMATVPTYIDERIDRMLKEIRAKKGIEVVSPEVSSSDPLVFSLDGTGQKDAPVEEPSLVVADAGSTEGGILVSTEPGPAEEVKEYLFTVHENNTLGTPIGTVRQMCTADQANVAMKVLAKASGRKVTVEVEKVVVQTETVMSWAPRSAEGDAVGDSE